MTPDAAEQIKSRLDILEVVGGYLSLHRSGRQHVGLCPFHSEKTPSFSVSQERQAFYCHGCHEGGDVITFIQKVERVDFPRALELLAERAGVELERDPQAAVRGARRRRSLELNARAARYYEYVLWNLPAGEPGRRLLSERRVDEQLARRFRVGFAPAGGPGGDGLMRYLSSHGAGVAEAAEAGLTSRGGRDLFRERLVFPIADERGQVLGFGGRALGDASPKYLNTPETGVYHKSMALFGLDQARQTLHDRRVAVVVEGYFDVLAAHAAGVTVAVASSGTALTPEQVRILARHADQAVLCFDGDEAGRRAAERAVDLCAAEKLAARIAVMPAGVKDPDEMVRIDPAGFATLVAGAGPEWQVLLDWAMGQVGSTAEERRSARARAVALLSRIPDPGVREPYVKEAMRRLELWEGSDFPAEVAAALSSGRRRPARAASVGAPSVSAPSGAPSGGAPGGAPSGGAPSPAGGPVGPDGSGRPASPSGEADGQGEPEAPLSSPEEYLATFVVQQPELARLLVDEFGLDLGELSSRAVRRLIEAALSATAGAAFPLHQLGPRDRQLAARLALRDVPELGPRPDPVALQHAMRDCVERVHLAASRTRTQREIDELVRGRPAAGGPGDEAMVARIRQLIAEQPRLGR